MLNAPRLSDLQSRMEAWRDAVILTGGVIAIVAICASVLVGFHARRHSIHANAPSVSDAGSATRIPARE